jgi:hypothetical protein
MRSTLIAVLWLAPSLALAQAAPPADLFGPANPQMKGPPTTYQSVFGKPSSGPEETPWRDANDEAARLGGHVGQLRESDDTTTASPSGRDTHGAANAAAPQRTHTHDHK